MKATSQAIALALAGMASLVAALGGVELPRDIKTHTALVAVDIEFITIANTIVLYYPTIAGMQDVTCH